MTPGFVRHLKQRPTLSLTIIATLACGIALNVAVFTVVNAVLIEPLPFAHSERIVAVGSVRADDPARMRTTSLNDLADWKARLRTLEVVGAWRDWSFRMRTADGLGSTSAVIVTPEVFTMFPVAPVLGRRFQAGEDRPGQNLVVLISERLWRERFGANPAAVGQTVNLLRAPAGEVAYTIVGVLPTDIGVPVFDEPDIWALSSTDEDAAASRELRNRQVIARLRPGVTLDEANAELEVVTRGLAQAYPASNAGWSARAVPITEWMLGSTRTVLLAFLVAVGSVVLIACVNVAGVMLASTAARRREFAVRLALGATRRGIASMVLVESIAVAVLAGAAAMLLAGWLVRALLSLGPAIPRADHSVVDWRVFLFGALLSIACGIVFGLAPAIRETYADVAEALRADRSGTASARSAKLRAFLVGTQVAVTLVLVVAAAASSRTVVALLRADPGFESRGVVVFGVFPDFQKYPTAPQVARAYQRVQEELSTIPGVVSAASVSAVPLFGGEEEVRYTLPGEEGHDVPRSVLFHNVTPRYFATIGIPLLEGRDLSWRDDLSAPPAAIVNGTFARAAWPGRSAVGRQVQTDEGTFTVVGVVGDVTKRLEPGAAPQAEIYYPYSQRARWMTHVVLRTDGPSTQGGLLSLVKDRLRAVDPQLEPTRVRTMEEMIARAQRGPRFIALLFGVFAGVALLLSVVGVYGLVAYTLAQRTREIGIRMSLGARSSDVLRVTVGNASFSIAAGAATGIAGAIAARRALSAAVPSMGAIDGAQIAVVAAVLTIGGVAAAYLPARRALRIDPVRTLRDE
jgi:putative ABC transport system permease protein